MWWRWHQFTFHEILIWLRDLLCLFFVLLSIWIKLHIIGFAYSFIKSTVLQKNSLAYNFLFWLITLALKKIAPFTSWVFSLFLPHPLCCFALKVNAFYIRFIFHSAYKFFIVDSRNVFHFLYLIWGITLICILFHFFILRNTTYPQYNLGLERGRIQLA